MMNKVIFCLSGVFWAVMMGWLVRVDLLPMYEVYDKPDYRAVVEDLQAPVVREMAVYQGDEEVGSSHTVLMPARDGTVTIRNFTNLQVKVAMFESRVTAFLELYISRSKQLDKLMLSVNAGDRHAEVNGRRVGNQLNLAVTFNGEKFFQQIPYDDAMVSSYFEPFGFGSKLKEGQEWHTKFLDPLAQTTSDAVVRVVGLEDISISTRKDEPPKKIKAYKVVMKAGTFELNAWATQDGVILKEETPLGYTLVYRESDDNDTTKPRVEELRAETGGQGPESGDPQR